jgi:uroporphyrinogen decarboxylase
MDPAALKRDYGDRLSFRGAIGTQSTLPFGSPDDVRREVPTRIETAGASGGLFLAPMHVIELDVPFENIAAFVDAVREERRVT